MLFKNLFDISFFENYLREKRNLSDSSLYIYLKVAEKFLLEYDDVYDLESYNKFLIKYAIKGRSSHYYTALKAFIEYKVEDKGHRAALIEGLIQPPQHSTMKTERKHLDEDQIIQIINNMNLKKHKVIALIQDLTGVRAGDVLRIPRGNIIPEVYEDKNVLKIIIEGKGKKRNVVYIHDEVVQEIIVNFIIKNFIHPKYYFLEDKRRLKTFKFYEQRNHKSNYVAYYRDLKQAMHKIGLSPQDFATHDYRRCYARRVWTKYKDLHVLQELLNHQNPATTMRYLKQSGMQNIEYHRQMQS